MSCAQLTDVVRGKYWHHRKSRSTWESITDRCEWICRRVSHALPGSDGTNLLARMLVAWTVPKALEGTQPLGHGTHASHLCA